MEDPQPGLANTNSGATTLSSGTLQLGNAAALQNSTLVAAGGALDLSLLAAGDRRRAERHGQPLNSGTLNVGNNSANSTYSGNLSGSVPVFKIGAGALTLTGSNAYAGTMTVSRGELYVNGSLKAAGAVDVSSGGTLGGTGSLTSVTVNAGGHLAPGDLNTGALILVGSADFEGGELDIVGTGSSVTSLSIAGNLVLNGRHLMSPGALLPERTPLPATAGPSAATWIST